MPDRRPRILAPAAALLVALLLLPAALARADTGPAVLEIPAGPPVQLDGRVVLAEWERGLEIPFGQEGTRLRLCQRRGTLMIAFETEHAWEPGANITFYFCPDRAGAHLGTPGFLRINYEPREHNRSHLIVTRRDERQEQRIRDRVVARRVLAEHAGSVELALDLELLGVEDDRGGPLRFCVHWARPGTSHTTTWPEGLSFGGPVGRPPPALTDTERWARMQGWREADGPGAFAPSQVKAWLEEDAEIGTRGARAHAEVRGLLEEWRKTTKRDSELVPVVLGNLRWIGEREPLTPTDLLAMTKTLRWLNRTREAAGMLDVLVHDPQRAVAQEALYERALTYEAMERYGDAAGDWTALAQRVGGAAGGAYERRREAVEKKQAALAKEQEARAEDDARDDLPLVALQTSRGTVVLQLYAADVPEAVKHFLGLVESKFYDGTLFHRVIGDFMAQGGDPISRDQGCEFAGAGTSPTEVAMETNARHGFWRGAIGFARKMRETNGSQFFIMTSPRMEMDAYTCFGRVVAGMESVDRIEHCDVLISARILRR